MAFRMKGSPLLKDVKMYDGNGEMITVDGADLGKVYRDDNGNEARDYTYTNKKGEKGTDVLYMTKPRGESEWEKRGGPSREKPIDQKRNFA